jgi:SAM-dependent methyltransferase
MHDSTTACRSCGGARRQEILSFGLMPLADRLLTEKQLSLPEPRFPLTVLYCEDCSLVQIRETVSPDLLYRSDYPYYSSCSDSWLRHCRDNARELIEILGLNGSSLVMEIACNDGYMLRNFHEWGIPVLGIDPASGPATAAESLGIPVITDYFTEDLAGGLRDAGRRADLILANNVLAHVADLTGFVSGIRSALEPGGMAVLEVPYVRDLIEHCEFDTIYHEHHCYFSVTSLRHLFSSQGLSLNDVRRLPTHGGSLRLYVGKSPTVSDSVRALLEEEKRDRIDRIDAYRTFAQRVGTVQQTLRELLDDLRSAGKRLAAYAASAKGATLLNSAGIGRDLLDYVVDRNPHKQGSFMPGVHLPVCDPARLLEDRPDYVLLLAWNLKDEILEQQAEYVARGGRFIVPVPEPAVI